MSAPAALALSMIPGLSLLAPSDNSNVSGTVTFVAAADADGLVSLQFQVDGSNYGSAITSGSCRASFDTRSTTDGPHTVQAVARDGFGNTVVTQPATIFVNNLAPAISGVGVGHITTSSATINWNTVVDADSRVDFGTTTSYGGSAYDGTTHMSHALTLANLSASTTYHFRALSVGQNGILSASGDFVFTTAAAPAPTPTPTPGPTPTPPPTQPGGRTAGTDAIRVGVAVPRSVTPMSAPVPTPPSQGTAEGAARASGQVGTAGARSTTLVTTVSGAAPVRPLSGTSAASVVRSAGDSGSIRAETKVIDTGPQDTMRADAAGAHARGAAPGPATSSSMPVAAKTRKAPAVAEAGQPRSRAARCSTPDPFEVTGGVGLCVGGDWILLWKPLVSNGRGGGK